MDVERRMVLGWRSLGYAAVSPCSLGPWWLGERASRLAWIAGALAVGLIYRTDFSDCLHFSGWRERGIPPLRTIFARSLSNNRRCFSGRPNFHLTPRHVSLSQNCFQTRHHQVNLRDQASRVCVRHDRESGRARSIVLSNAVASERCY